MGQYRLDLGAVWDWARLVRNKGLIRVSGRHIQGVMCHEKAELVRGFRRASVRGEERNGFVK
jgi:hypothetical protein